MKKRKADGGQASDNVADYRHKRVTRLNIPPAGLEARGEIAKERRIKWAYNPHLAPALRFAGTGRAAIFGLFAFVRANKETCKEPFTEMAHLINRTGDLEESLLRLYGELEIPVQIKAHGIPKEALPEIAFYTSRDAVKWRRTPQRPASRRSWRCSRRCTNNQWRGQHKR